MESTFGDQIMMLRVESDVSQRFNRRVQIRSSSKRQARVGRCKKASRRIRRRRSSDG